MINYTTSSWFPLYKFKIGDGLCDSDYMLGSTKFRNFKDFLTGEKIPQYSTVIWSRKFKVNILLDNYLNLKNKKEYKDKLSEISLLCDLKV